MPNSLIDQDCYQHVGKSDVIGNEIMARGNSVLSSLEVINGAPLSPFLSVSAFNPAAKHHDQYDTSLLDALLDRADEIQCLLYISTLRAFPENSGRHSIYGKNKLFEERLLQGSFKSKLRLLYLPNLVSLSRPNSSAFMRQLLSGVIEKRVVFDVGATSAWNFLPVCHVAAYCTDYLSWAYSKSLCSAEPISVEDITEMIKRTCPGVSVDVTGTEVVRYPARFVERESVASKAKVLDLFEELFRNV